MKYKIVIIGAGGHGKIVLDAILAQDVYEVIGFIDDNIGIGNHVIKNFKVISSLKNIESLKNDFDYFIIGIGNNNIREQLYTKLKENIKSATIIHPSAIIGSDVKIFPGCVILANAIINTDSTIGENSIINSGVIIDHECRIGNHVHLSIGSIIGSNSVVLDYVKTTLGEIINPFTTFDKV